MKKVFVFLLSITSAVAIFILVGNILHTLNEKNDDKNLVTTIDWKITFEENGFSSDEISEYEVMLNNVGVTDFHDVEVIENGRMHIIKGKAFDFDDCYLHITLEDKKIIAIWISMPDFLDSENYFDFDYRVRIKYGDGYIGADLYYDVEGGYLAKVDFENKIINPY